MTFYEIALLSLGLAMDCFSVAICAGTCGAEQTGRFKFRIAFHFGLFQGGFAFIGWLAGNTIVSYLAAFDHWIAFFLLLWVGVRMIKEGFDPQLESMPTDPSRGMTLMMLSVATSIDALAVGLSLALLQVHILYTAIAIGLVSLLMSLLGLFLGRKLGQKFGKKVEVVGGAVLLFIGLRILIEHLLL